MSDENRKTRIDEILDTIDAGLQSTTEASYGETPYDGARSSSSDRLCIRCDDAVETGEFCPGCRAYLLGDDDTDPARYPQRWTFGPGTIQIGEGDPTPFVRAAFGDFEDLEIDPLPPLDLPELAAIGLPFEEFSERFRILSEQMVEAIRPLAEAYLDSYERVRATFVDDDVVDRLRAAIEIEEHTDDEGHWQATGEILGIDSVEVEIGQTITFQDFDWIVLDRDVTRNVLTLGHPPS